jgi:hypothetical protein
MDLKEMEIEKIIITETTLIKFIESCSFYALFFPLRRWVSTTGANLLLSSIFSNSDESFLKVQR